MDPEAKDTPVATQGALKPGAHAAADGSVEEKVGGGADYAVPITNHYTLHLIAPPNFGIVENGIYRSAHPHQLNFPFLTELDLQLVLNFSPAPPSATFVNFCDDEDIRLVSLPIDGQSPREDIVVEALRLILTQKTGTLLICTHGRHRTGLIVGCLKKVQGWSFTSILEEYRRHAGAKRRLLNEQFIEMFDVELLNLDDEGGSPTWL